MLKCLKTCSMFMLMGFPSLTLVQADIVQDAEYYVLEAQNGERWAAEDDRLNERLAELRHKS